MVKRFIIGALLLAATSVAVFLTMLSHARRDAWRPGTFTREDVNRMRECWN